MNLDEFMADRDAALLSLDLARINAYLVKYGSPPMDDKLTAWAAIHKARTALRDFPEDERQKSKDWLSANGFSHWGDSH